MVFTGTFDHTLDAKNRLTVPARFRPALGGGLFMVKGLEPCVAVWPTEGYSATTSAALAGLNPFSPQARDLKRFFYANAFDDKLDSAGRIMLPGALLAHAGVDREVHILGQGDYLEIWDRERWRTYNDDLPARAGELTANLGHPA